MKSTLAVHWFRQDLRVSDNPALAKAAEHKRVLPIYILDSRNAGQHLMGEASRWWLHYSLNSLNVSLDGNLSVYQGDPLDILKTIMTCYAVEAVYWNRCYEPWSIDRDVRIKEYLKTNGVAVETRNGTLLWEPWTIKKEDGNPYKVFSPFYRKGCLQGDPPREPLSITANVQYQYDKHNSLSIQQLKLLPEIRWDKQLESHWDIGEAGAAKRFQSFLESGIKNYKDGRNFPSKAYVSRLSPHLHFGEISPNQLWYQVRSLANNEHVDHFCSELGWREFSYCLLYYNQSMPTKNLHSKFDNFPWVDDPVFLEAWQKGHTGIPMVDAGMRELWQTGYMHGRVRMIAGSFLVKNLRLHWTHGERWFWNTLVDADLANNSASWQWIAGCGADAAPYFRIFNPVTQGKKFDPEGEYVRYFLPELASLPNKYLFNPWQAPKHILKEADIELGMNYPQPIVDLMESRKVALQSFQLLKK